MAKRPLKGMMIRGRAALGSTIRADSVYWGSLSNWTKKSIKSHLAYNLRKLERGDYDDPRPVQETPAAHSDNPDIKNPG